MEIWCTRPESVQVDSSECKLIIFGSSLILRIMHIIIISKVVESLVYTYSKLLDCPGQYN